MQTATKSGFNGYLYRHWINLCSKPQSASVWTSCLDCITYLTYRQKVKQYPAQQNWRMMMLKWYITTARDRNDWVWWVVSMSQPSVLGASTSYASYDVWDGLSTKTPSLIWFKHSSLVELTTAAVFWLDPRSFWWINFRKFSMQLHELSLTLESTIGAWHTPEDMSYTG